ncbi:MAG: hypothetical protein ABL882_09975 [Sphingopyxis sp.]
MPSLNAVLVFIGIIAVWMSLATLSVKWGSRLEAAALANPDDNKRKAEGLARTIGMWALIGIHSLAGLWSAATGAMAFVGLCVSVFGYPIDMQFLLISIATGLGAAFIYTWTNHVIGHLKEK